MPADLLRLAARARSLPGRLARLSAALLGRPYAVGPLPGPEGPELLVARLDAFDCVTFVEAVLALGVSRSPAEFPARLRALRYRGGAIGWATRNHYTSTWLAENAAAGLLAPLLAERWVEGEPPRRLDVLAGHPALAWTPRFLPWSEHRALARIARAGDWVGFVSTRADLDAFHVGLLVPGTELSVRHASRSRGAVVQEPLETFMARNEVPGLLVARPVLPPGGPT